MCMSGTPNWTNRSAPRTSVSDEWLFDAGCKYSLPLFCWCWGAACTPDDDSTDIDGPVVLSGDNWKPSVQGGLGSIWSWPDSFKTRRTRGGGGRRPSRRKKNSRNCRCPQTSEVLDGVTLTCLWGPFRGLQKTLPVFLFMLPYFREDWGEGWGGAARFSQVLHDHVWRNVEGWNCCSWNWDFC